MTGTFPLIAVLLTASPVALPVAQAVPRVQVSPNSDGNLGFDWDKKNVNGDDHLAPVFRAVITYTNPVAPSVKVTVVWDSAVELDVGLTKIPLSVALVGVPSGDWDCTVQLEDVAGNRSAASVVTDRSRFTVTADPPTAPQNVGVVD